MPDGSESDPPPIAISAWCACGLLALYCLIRARESPLLTGVPLSVFGFVLVVLLILGAAAAPPRFWRWSWTGLILWLLVFKVALAAFAPASGWAGAYFANDAFRGGLERSTEFRSRRWTRLDGRLDFSGSRFPLHFLNNLRFNNDPNREAPPFSVVYEGFVRMERDEDYAFELTSLNPAWVMLDGVEILRAPAPDGLDRVRASVRLRSGTRWLQVWYQNPANAPRLLRLQATSAAGDGAELDDRVRPERTSRRTEVLARSLRIVWAGIDGLAVLAVCLWVGLGLTGQVSASRQNRVAPLDAAGGLRLAIGTACAAAAVVEFVWWTPNQLRIVLIQNGFDAFAYEDYARRALLDGWLLNSGSLAGRPYLYMIGYHYVMSVLHWLFGESLLAVHFGHSLMLLASLVLAAGIARRLLGWPAAWLTLFSGLYLGFTVYWLRTYVFRENLLLPLDLLLAYLLLRIERFRAAGAVALGLVMGLNCLTDFINVVLIVPIGALVGWTSASGTARRNVGLFAAVTLLCLASMPARNAIVAGFPTLLPTEGPPTLWWGNRAPPGLPEHVSGEDDHNRVVLGYLKAEPVHFMAQMASKAVYSVGFYRFGPENNAGYLPFSLINLLAVAIALVAFAPLVRINPRILVLYGLCFMKWITIVVYNAAHNVDRYESVLIMMLLPIMATGLVCMWRWNRVLPVLVVGSILAYDYSRVLPQLGNHQFALVSRLYGQSYTLKRQALVPELVRRQQRLSWNMAADASEWKDGDDIAFVPGPLPTYQLLKDTGGSIHSPRLEVPADAIQQVVIEGGFSGWAHVARLLVWRDNRPLPSWIAFPVDSSGLVQEYRVPVARSGDWNGVITRVDIGYSGGDSVTLRAFRFEPYQDVAKSLEKLRQ